MQRLSSRDEADTNLEPVLAHAADVALAEVGAPVADVPPPSLLRIRHGDRRWRIDFDRSGPRLCHDRGSVEQAHVPVDGLDAEGAVEWWRQAERHLDLVRFDESGEATTRVAAVRGRERPTVPARQHDLHGCETS